MIKKMLKWLVILVVIGVVSCGPAQTVPAEEEPTTLEQEGWLVRGHVSGEEPKVATDLNESRIWTFNSSDSRAVYDAGLEMYEAERANPPSVEINGQTIESGNNDSPQSNWINLGIYENSLIQFMEEAAGEIAYYTDTATYEYNGQTVVVKGAKTFYVEYGASEKFFTLLCREYPTEFAVCRVNTDQ